MEFEKMALEGAWLITPKVFGDARGYFMEAFKADEFREHVGNISFVQDNESMSTYGVLRGLHFQDGDAAQAKLVRVSCGKVIDVAVDIRPYSPTFGKHIAVELSDENHRQLFIPRGCAHGFVVLSDIAQFQYKVDNIYAPEHEHTLRYDDPTLGIDWVLPHDKLKLSEKDLKGIPFSECKP